MLLSINSKSIEAELGNFQLTPSLAIADTYRWTEYFVLNQPIVFPLAISTTLCVIRGLA